MGIDVAIEKLKVSNQGLKVIRDNIHENLADIGSDPRLKGLTNDLESLFESYLATWMKSNSEVLNILEKDDKK